RSRWTYLVWVAADAIRATLLLFRRVTYAHPIPGLGFRCLACGLRACVPSPLLCWGSDWVFFEMAQAVEQWYKQMPLITRSYLTAAVATTLGCSIDVSFLLLLFLPPISPFGLGLGFKIHCCLSMLLVPLSFLNISDILEGVSDGWHILYLNPKLVLQQYEIWRLNDLYVLLGFSVLVGSNAWVDLLIDRYGDHYLRQFMWFLLQGMIAGHTYYFLEDVYPQMTGRRPLKTPWFIKALFADGNVVLAADARFAPPAQNLHQD
ncbi:hypothetical protein BHE74_00031440, partial [Ensete ventricosum]